MNNVELSWWRINLSCVRVPHKYKIDNPVAITINGANRKESKLVKQWCKELSLILRKTSYFDDDLIYTRPNGTKYQMYYVNNERVAIGNHKDIEKLENLLNTIQSRCYEVLIEDIDSQLLKEIVKGYNTRIISNDSEQTHLISFDDPELRVELVLRS